MLLPGQLNAHIVTGIPERYVPATIRQDGMIVGDDGHLYAPQTTPEGRHRVISLLMEKAGVATDKVRNLADAILATVNLMGPKLCTCLHVEGGSDPAHGHGYYQCESCGGLCCSERWVGHEVMGLRWMELMMQQHRHGKVVVQALNFVQDRLLDAVEIIARTVPREHQKRAVKDAIRSALAEMSHIWHQSTLGDYLYQTGEQRGGPTTPRVYEEAAGVLVEKLKAVKGGCSPEEFVARFGHQDHITPEQALARVEATKRRAAESTTKTPDALPEASTPLGEPIVDEAPRNDFAEVRRA